VTARKGRKSDSRKVRRPAPLPRGKAESELGAEDLAELTREFDDEFIADSFTEPTAQQKAQLQRAKRKRGRPRTGKGVKVISLSLERGLLAEADRMAKRLGVPRSELLSRGLRLVLRDDNGPEAARLASLRQPTSSR